MSVLAIFTYVRSYELVATSGDGVYMRPKAFRRGFTSFIAGTEILACPAKHRSPQPLIPLVVTHLLTALKVADLRTTKTALPQALPPFKLRRQNWP